MITTMKRLVFSIAMTGLLLWNANGAEVNEKKPVDADVGILDEQIVESGAKLTIQYLKRLSKINKARTDLEKNDIKTATKYQWRKNDEDIPGEKDDKLTIAAAGHTNAGKYTVVVKGPLDEESAPVFISVFTKITGSEGGTLTVPVTAFSQQSATTVCTNANNFVKWKSYTLCGKSVLCPLPFGNPGFDNLKVNTCNPQNQNVNTAIVVHNFNTGAQVGCNDRHETPCLSLNGNTGVSSIPLISLNANHTYKVTIWLKSVTQANVTWTWLYF